jgi:RNA polymerase sigma-70 factor (ECF subfamily)
MSDGDLDITEQLQAWRSGDAAALEQLTPFLYSELRRLARRYLSGERPDHTLTPTALINEAYLRLLGQKQPDWQNRDHFVGVVAHLMRQILVDFARHRRASKRGGGCSDVSLDDALPKGVPPEADLVDLDQALLRLEQTDARKARAIELRYFAGLTVEETATVLEVSPATIHRELRMAEAWLCRELSSGRPADSDDSDRGLAISARA